MSRKRFIKLLMSHGYSRNEAVHISDLSKTPYVSYQQYYESVRLGLSLKKIGISINRFSKRLAEMAKNLNSIFKYFN